MPLSVGSPAPDFTLKSMTAEGLVDIKLSDNFGHRPTVLLFFPAAFTSVCTDEMCSVSQGLTAYEGASVYGVSADSPFAQSEWAKMNGISIPLLSDYKREVAEAYGVLLPDLVGLGPAAARAAVVIDQDGVVRYAEQTPTPKDLPDFGKVQETLAGLKPVGSV